MTVLIIENRVIYNRVAAIVACFANINETNYCPITSGLEPFMQNGTWVVSVGNVVGGGSILMECNGIEVLMRITTRRNN